MTNMTRIWASAGGRWVDLQVDKVTPEWVFLRSNFIGPRRLRRKPLESDGRVRAGAAWFFTDTGKAAEDAETARVASSAVHKRRMTEAQAEATLHREREQRMFWHSLQTASRRSRGTVYAAEEVARLKAAMAAAHPDKGGSNEAFRKAHAKYVQARGGAQR